MDKRKGPGRPPLPKQQRRLNKETITYTDVEHAAVKRTAKAHGFDTVREWLRDYSTRVAQAATRVKL